MTGMFKSLNAAFFPVFITLAGCGSPNTKLPSNAIVSTTLCADGYLHALPELEPRLAALSWQSRSALSRTPDQLRALPQADSDPERRLMWASALEVSSAGGTGDIDLRWGEDFDSVWKNLALLSTTMAVPDPSDGLRSRLSALNKPDVPPRILYMSRSGATAGPGTFVNAVIEAAGAVNIIETSGWQSPDTETLISLQPDIILTSFMDSDYAGVTDRALRHAALSSKIQTLPRIDIPGSLWPCAGPGLVEAAEQLSQEIAKL
jgi:iron complex transport system substrate-binding protein